MTNKLKSYLIKESNVDTLLHIHRNNGETYGAKIKDQLEISTRGTHNKLDKLHEYGLIEKEKHAGAQLLSLTDRGKELAREFEELEKVRIGPRI